MEFKYAERMYIFVFVLGKHIEPFVSNILFVVYRKAILSLEIVDHDKPFKK